VPPDDAQAHRPVVLNAAWWVVCAHCAAAAGPAESAGAACDSARRAGWYAFAVSSVCNDCLRKLLRSVRRDDDAEDDTETE
jgi:hypothetical protein